MIAMAGSVESCDCLITIFESDKIEIDLTSDVLVQYGEQIEKVILATLKEHNINNLRVVIEDKGALDYTIIARLTTALRRGNLI